tara:strand:- start:828 stop:1016 length:189 start_codon:yes stop_codon:yes gene_type:complete
VGEPFGVSSLVQSRAVAGSQDETQKPGAGFVSEENVRVFVAAPVFDVGKGWFSSRRRGDSRG